ncbi:MAG TPA: hypothetical protein V6D08_16450 [Candidatus Obscuribacterales bacterium]
MAVLKSEDTDCRSSLEIAPAGSVQDAKDGSRWQPIRLSLVSGGRCLEIGGENGKNTCLVLRSPRDEIARLLGLLDELANGRRHRILFEPQEPSFELLVESTPEGGFKVEAWIDAGNATTGFYSWDAAGIRFYTLAEHLASFFKQLQLEFPTSRHQQQRKR